MDSCLKDGFVENAEGDYCLGEFVLPRCIYDKLYPYQREGVAWLWNIRRASEQNGGVLGDDMGLGKTVQVSAFLTGLFHSGLASRVLILSPLSVMAHWSRCLEAWCEDVTRKTFHGTKEERARVMREVRMTRRPGIILTTYGTVRSNVYELGDCEGNWDYMILDEGHKIKGHNTDIARAVRLIPVVNRLVLTGTPLQNNLRELWAVFDFAVHGKALEDLATFRDVFETPILRGHEVNATPLERRAGNTTAEELRRRIKPYFLRRTKDDTNIFSEKRDDPSNAGTEPQDGDAAEKGDNPLPRKKDLIVWVKPSKTQVTLYSGFLKSRAVSDVLNERNSALAALTVLKKICDHPWILTHDAFNLCGDDAGNVSLGNIIPPGLSSDPGPALYNGWGQSLYDGTGPELYSGAEPAAYNGAGPAHYTGAGPATYNGAGPAPYNGAGPTSYNGVGPAPYNGSIPAPYDGPWRDVYKGETLRETADDDEQEHTVLEDVQAALDSSKNIELSLRNSAKLSLLMQLLGSHRREGHHTLVFSQSLKMLDIIQSALMAMTNDPDCYCRIDGSTPPAMRQTIIDAFNDTSSKAFCMLLTSGVGGLGLTITRADRVVIYDLSWNPVVDAQAIDRSYRIGQKRDVLVYRLITCGTVEEKIYKRQVYKGALARSATQEGRSKGVFSKHELAEVFTLDETEQSKTQEMFDAMLGRVVAPDVFKSQLSPFEPHVDWVKGLGEVFNFTHNDLVLQWAPAAIGEEHVSEAINLDPRLTQPLAANTSNEFPGTSGFMPAQAPRRQPSLEGRYSPAYNQFLTGVVYPDSAPGYTTPGFPTPRRPRPTGLSSTPQWRSEPSLDPSGTFFLPPVDVGDDVHIDLTGGKPRAPPGARNYVDPGVMSDVVWDVDADSPYQPTKAAAPSNLNPNHPLDDDDDCVIVGQTSALTPARHDPDTEHVLQTIRSINPRRELTDTQVAKYDSLLASVRQNEEHGHLSRALFEMFQMMDICDEDKNLQMRILRLSKRLKVLRDGDFGGSASAGPPGSSSDQPPGQSSGPVYVD